MPVGLERYCSVAVSGAAGVNASAMALRISSPSMPRVAIVPSGAISIRCGMPYMP